MPFAEKWRTAVGFIEEDLASGYPKVWAELEAIAWNTPEMRDRLNARQRALALAAPRRGQRGDRGVRPGRRPLLGRGLAALVMQFNKGLLFERLLGFDRGHAELLASIDGWLTSLEEGRT